MTMTKYKSSTLKLIFSSLLSAIILLSSFSPLDVNITKIKTVVIDAGHGGKDPGCHGASSNESEVVLQIGLELGRIIEENMEDVKVIYTRQTDEFVELHERAKVANMHGADLFISLHCNAGPPAAAGTETYVMGLHSSERNLDVAKRENSVILQEEDYKEEYNGFDPNSDEGYIMLANQQCAFLEQSLQLASKIEHQFDERVKRHSRGVKQAGFLVLWRTTMPSVLVEMGFLTNKDEENYLIQKENQVLMASGIYRAFKEYKNELEN